METFIDLQKKVYPDLVQAMYQRYNVLHNVNIFQPVGRRGLAEKTNLTERIVRNEITFLQNNGFIRITPKGMYITEEGILTLEQLDLFMNAISGLTILEEKLKAKLNVDNVIIVSGNSDEDNWVKYEMGKACVSFLKANSKANNVITVAGGTTMAAIAEAMVPLQDDNHLLFVPARGGVGEKVENQANTIVAEMAHKARGSYQLLHVPDPLSETTYKTMIKEPSVVETLQLIKGSNIVLHGIGDALTMAERRKTSTETIDLLKGNKAISEAFGYYFDHTGQVVHKVRTIGIQMEDLVNVEHVVAVAGGESKAKAITSYFKQGKSDLLITDEGAARYILK